MSELIVVEEYKEPGDFLNSIDIKISGRKLYSFMMSNSAEGINVFEKKPPSFRPLHAYLRWLACVLEIYERDMEEYSNVGLKNRTIDRIGERIRKGNYRDWDDAMNKILDEVENL